MKVLDLFSGIGGFSLGLERAGMETVAFCEYDKKAQLVLKKHWPDVPIFDDIRELTYDQLQMDGVVAYPNASRRDTQPLSGTQRTSGENHINPIQSGETYQLKRPSKTSAIDVVCGGFPCQPWSGAGKQRGHQDDRDLWPEMLRVIREVQPRWVIGENVQGFVNKDMGLPRTIADLEGEGYETRTFVIPACGVSAPHQRYRVWVIGLLNAHSEHLRSTEQERQHQRAKEPDGSSTDELATGDDVAYSTHEGAGGDNRGIWSRACGASGGEGPNKEATTSTMGYTGLFGQEEHEKQTTRVEQPGETVAHSQCKRQQGQGESERPSNTKTNSTREASGFDNGGQGWEGHWDIEPSVGRVAHGVPNRVDRLKQLGNAVVPQVVEQIGRAIMQAEGL